MECCCLVTRNKYVYIRAYSRGCLSATFWFSKYSELCRKHLLQVKNSEPKRTGWYSYVLLFSISVDRFPKACKWDGINRSVSLPGSQAFCYIPSQSGKTAYLKINFKTSPKIPNSKLPFPPLFHSISLKLKRDWARKETKMTRE